MITRKYLVLLIAATVAQGTLFATADSAKAIVPFMRAFAAKYVNKESTDPEDRKFAATVKSAKCNLCHKGKKKKDRNAYGEALSQFLDKKKDKNNKEKIEEALEKVAKLKSDPNDDQAATFGDLIAQRKLPAGRPK